MTGCSGSGTDDPIRFNDPPVWTHKDVGMDSVAGAAIRGESVIVAGTHENNWRLTVADAKTGTMRWSIAEDQVLPGGDDLRVINGMHPSPFVGAASSPVVVDDGDDWSVIVGYGEAEADADAETTAWGVAALSSTDGSLKWARPLVEPDKDDSATSDDGVFPVAANGNTVLATTYRGVRAFAVDAGTGEKRWEHEEVWPYAVARDVVIGQEAVGDDAPWSEDGNDGGAIYGWNAKSGEKLWKSDKTNGSLGLDLATESVAVVSDSDGGRVLDAESGRQIGELSDGVIDCTVDAADGSRFACSSDGVCTIAVGTVEDGQATIDENVITHDREGFSVTGMYAGRIFVDTDDDNTVYNGQYIINTDAEVIAKQVPGRTAAISKEYALFLSGEDDYTGYPEAGLHEVAKS